MQTNLFKLKLLTDLKLKHFSLLKMVFETSKGRVTFLSSIFLVEFFKKQLTIGSININHRLNFKKHTEKKNELIVSYKKINRFQ